MTDNRFDELTRILGKSASRRTVFKGVLAAALGGLLTRAGSHDADAFRGRRGCGRLGQDCGGTNPGCCVGLTCGENDICCAAPGDFCLEDSDCCEGGCDPYSHTCSGLCTPEDGECEGPEDCCPGLFCAPNPLEGGAGETYCVSCLPFQFDCSNDTECCSGVCFGTCAGGQVG